VRLHHMVPRGAAFAILLDYAAVPHGRSSRQTWFPGSDRIGWDSPVCRLASAVRATTRALERRVGCAGLWQSDPLYARSVHMHVERTQGGALAERRSFLEYYPVPQVAL